jgi:FlaA1/EpsC-like NDP-sugar epimerase
MSEANTLLITGGTGSFGNAVLQRFLKTDTFSEIRIFSRDEKKQDDMRQFYRDTRIQYYIGDVRSEPASVMPYRVTEAYMLNSTPAQICYEKWQRGSCF